MLCAVICTYVCSSAKAGIFFGGGLGVMDGLVIEGGYTLNPFIALRARGTYLRERDVTAITTRVFTGIDTSGISVFKLSNKAFDLGFEVRPTPFVPIIGKITLIGAIQYLETNLTLSGYVINGKDSIPGSLTISNREKFAPYLGIGIDIINLPFISLRTTFGATMRSYAVKRINYNIPSEFVNRVNEETAKLNKDIGKMVIIPSITLTARIKL